MSCQGAYETRTSAGAAGSAVSDRCQTSISSRRMLERRSSRRSCSILTGVRCVARPGKRALLGPHPPGPSRICKRSGGQWRKQCARWPVQPIFERATLPRWGAPVRVTAPGWLIGRALPCGLPSSGWMGGPASSCDGCRKGMLSGGSSKSPGRPSTCATRGCRSPGCRSMSRQPCGRHRPRCGPKIGLSCA